MRFTSRTLAERRRRRAPRRAPRASDARRRSRGRRPARARARARATRRATSSSRATSPATASAAAPSRTTRSISARVRANTVTATPRPVSARATAAPMPRPPPVTMAVRARSPAPSRDAAAVAAPRSPRADRPRAAPPAPRRARAAPRARGTAAGRRRPARARRERLRVRARVRARRSPRTVRQSCSASSRHAAPRAPTCSTSASAIVAGEVLLEHEPVREASTSFTIWPNPTTRPPGRYATWATPARRQQVVRADRVEVDPGHRHEIAARARRWRSASTSAGSFAVAVDEILEPGLRHPRRGVASRSAAPRTSGGSPSASRNRATAVAPTPRPAWTAGARRPGRERSDRR